MPLRTSPLNQHLTELNDMFYIATYTYVGKTIAPTYHVAFSKASDDIPSGYTPVAVTTISNNGAILVKFDINGDMTLTSNQSTGGTYIPSMKVLCVKTALLLSN